MLEQAIYLKQNVNFFFKFRHFTDRLSTRRKSTFKCISVRGKCLEVSKWQFQFCSPNHKTPTSTLSKKT